MLLHKLDVYVVHSNSLIEKELFSKNRSYIVRSGRSNKRGVATKVVESIKVLLSIIQALIILIKLRPKIIFSKGGFNSIPVLFWAKIIGIPYILHESDCVMGKANRMYASKAKAVFVSFPKDCYEKNNINIKYSGMIVRDFNHTKKGCATKTIFITGGSLGAKALSEIISEILPTLLKKYRIIYNSGTANQAISDDILNKIDKEKLKNYESFSFSYSKMTDALNRCDLVITRSGANIIGEIAKLKKASILIPYPYATNNHQMKNAKFLERMGGAILIRQEMLTSNTLLDRIEYLFSDERNIKVVGENADKSIKHDGKDIVVNEILKILGKL